ncbi:allantoate amidohydrolase [Dermacoccus abyssi]|uniref:allantoate amidohydrolase n=1 Tax=Dermacoccus abyssi TaxID=322596 RepID=UPI0015F98C24|nr:allantoate amidohydrolase [Dermacoccus abyssi]
MSETRRFESLWNDLHPVGRDGGSGGYRRFAWTREDATLREWFVGECAALGLDVTEDRAGNQWAWWGNPDDAPGEGVVTGSHLDSVPDGGAFDGPLGVVSSLLAVKALQEKGFAPRKPIGVVNFVDEEGARFGVACAGSRIITGALDADRARSLTDADGVTMAEAWQRAGRDPGTLGRDDETLARVGTFVELHVEQGRALIDLDDAPVAIGTDIWPHGRFRADLPGRADHAGTTALGNRDDALLKAAQFIEATRGAAARVTARARAATASSPPSASSTWCREASMPSRRTSRRGWTHEAPGRRTCGPSSASSRSAPGHLGGSWRAESWTPTTPFDAGLVEQLDATLSGVPLLGTGAGHDAGILANHGVPTAMLFVRNPTGTSHSPEEFAETDDCVRGVEALVRVLEDLAG